MNAKLTHKQRIERAHITLIRNKDWVWLAPVCLIGKVIICDDIPTAGTDGRDVYYGAAFIDKCNDAQLLSTVVHENLHKAFRHFSVYNYLDEKYKDYPGLVNQAMDHVINQHIKKGAPFLQMWDGIIGYRYDKKYENSSIWDTPRVLEDLLKNSDQGQGGGGGQDNHDWAGAEEIPQQEAEALGKAVEQALRQGQVMSRKMAGNMPREVSDLLEPVVDWRQALRDFVTDRAKGGEFQTFARPNRRFMSDGLYRPSRYTETVESIGFFCDTSGSIGPEDLLEVLSEIQGCLEVVKPETVDVLYWDTAVARHEHYAGADVSTVMASTKPAGGGGTQPSCVVPFCQSRNIKPAVAIWLSDGYVGNDWAEELGVPAFWVISSGGQVPSHLPHVLLPRRN